MQLTTDVSKRIEILRTLLIAMIVLYHVPPVTDGYWQAANGLDGVTLWRMVMGNILVLAAVPGLSIISGYLFFQKIDTFNYLKRLKGKTRSLFVPLVLWNGGLLAALFLAHITGIFDLSNRPGVWPPELWKTANQLFGFIGYPADPPLHFIRDMFACALISPIIYVALRRAPWIGLGVISLILIFDVQTYIMNTERVLLGFYIGGILATKSFDLSALDRYAVPIVAGFLVFTGLFATAFLTLDLPDPTPNPLVTLIRILGVPAVWSLSFLLLHTRYASLLIRGANHAFFVYCVHSPIMTALHLTWINLFGAPDAATYGLFYITLALAILPLSLAACLALKRIWPGLHATITGRRTQSPKAAMPAAGLKPGEDNLGELFRR